MDRNKRFLFVSMLLLVALVFSSFSLPFHARAQDTTMSSGAFHDAMRKLWEDHITWTRLYIVSFAADLPDTDAVATRLLQNQTDIGNAVRPFYGDAAADQLAQLLTDHITGAVDILTAAKAGDTAGTEAAIEAWNANGNDIVVFLNGANPDNWALADLQAHMQMHLDLTFAEAQAHLAGDYEQSIAAYDQVHEHILALADILSEGIVAQFPEMFGVAMPEAPAEGGSTDTGTGMTTSLTGVAEVPGPGDEDGTGTTTVNINTDTNEVCVDISVQNITLPATAAHVHVGAAGVAGGPVIDLTPPDASGVSSTCMAVDPALVADLMANAANYYVNVHTTDYPDGAVRGQLGG
jgi:hypothetical protein